MAEAFKCDNCGEFKEGKPDPIRGYGDDERYIVEAIVAVKAPPKVESEEVERLDLPPGNNFLSHLARRIADLPPGDRAADLCDECHELIVRRAIRQAALT